MRTMIIIGIDFASKVQKKLKQGFTIMETFIIISKIFSFIFGVLQFYYD